MICHIWYMISYIKSLWNNKYIQIEWTSIMKHTIYHCLQLDLSDAFRVCILQLPRSEWWNTSSISDFRGEDFFWNEKPVVETLSFHASNGLHKMIHTLVKLPQVSIRRALGRFVRVWTGRSLQLIHQDAMSFLAPWSLTVQKKTTESESLKVYDASRRGCKTSN